MRRVSIEPRANWQDEVEKWGMLYHTHEGKPYWNESAYYELTSADVEALETATQRLHQMCLAAVEEIITQKAYARFHIPEMAHTAIEQSWRNRTPALYGRFDLAYNGTDAPKMLEYNADTPTALLEAAVVQWQWAQDVHPGSDQFNSIWEHLVARWAEWRAAGVVPEKVYFAHEESFEELMTVSLLRDTAQKAGLETEGMHLKEIGWNAGRREFVDLSEKHMAAIFKLYPWEWMLNEQFGRAAIMTQDRHFWIEPLWKMLLSNKAILAVLWELNPGDENLLPAYQDSPNMLTDYVKKPLLSREGANIEIVSDSVVIESTTGRYGEEGYVYQQLADLGEFDGFHPVIGSWVVGDEPCGVGIRETVGQITTDLASFVPNLIVG